VTYDDNDEAVYEYHLKDHLGNVRIAFADKDGYGYIEPFSVNPNEPNTGGVDGAAWNLTDTEILQESHYYPFGMAMDGAWQDIVNGAENNYLYNGKELQTDFDLGLHDYGARYYDAAIGRFTTTDRFAEMYSSMTPYQYGANNPILFIDVNGDSLDVGGNLSESFNDVQSVLNKKDKGRLSYDEAGKVSFNATGLKKKRWGKNKGKIRNKGARLLNNLVTSEDKFKYSKTHQHGEGLEYSTTENGTYTELGGSSLSTLNTEKYIGQTIGEGPIQFAWFTNTSKTARGDEAEVGYFFRPTESSGYDAIITISPGTVYSSDDTRSGRSGYVRHELKEAYLRTTLKQSYEKAHQGAGEPRGFYKFKYTK